MARNLIRLSGHEPDVDIKVVYTGLRPGEKLYEEILMAEEGLQETSNKLIHIGKPIVMDDRGVLPPVGSAGEGLSGGDGGHEGHRGLGGPHLSPQEIILQGQKPFKDNGKSKSSPDGIFRRGCSFTVGRLLCKAALRDCPSAGTVL